MVLAANQAAEALNHEGELGFGSETLAIVVRCATVFANMTPLGVLVTVSLLSL